MVCTDEVIITEVRCSNGGNHGVGESCNQGYINDAYYEVSIFTRCNGDRTNPVQIIEDTSSSNGGTTTVNVGEALADNFANTFLSIAQKNVYDSNPSIREYLSQNVIIIDDPNYNPLIGGDSTMATINQEAIDFAIELIDASINTGLTFDIEKSLNSPAFIDINSIDITTQEGKIFDCVFNKLMNSNNFKNLYNEIFNENNKINLEFEIANLNSTTKGGDTQAFYTFDSNNQITGIKNKIRINTYVLNNHSTLYVANVIVHEMLHAYLNVQQIGFGTDIYNLNNYDSLGDILVQNANGVISIITNGVTTDSHAFMFNYMIPAFTDIYNEILSELVNQNDLNSQSDVLMPGTNTLFNTEKMLYYLATVGLNKDKNNVLNSNYMSEIGNFSDKVDERSEYIFKLRNDFSKICN